MNLFLGGYQICGASPEQYDILGSRYFLNHSSLAWVQTNGTSAKNVPGVIKTGPAQQMVARFNYITPTGTFQTIGRVLDITLFYYEPGNTVETLTLGTFEVLTCKPRPVTYECGTLLQYTANDVTELGFDSGTFYDGSTIYIGTGAMPQCFGQNPSPARLTTSTGSKGPGNKLITTLRGCFS